jgi:hypothetical protein
MDGRFFGGRTLSAEFYDGYQIIQVVVVLRVEMVRLTVFVSAFCRYANYDVAETDEERERRIREFGKWLGTAEDVPKDPPA